MPQIKHVVLMRFKATTPRVKIDEIYNDLARLRDKLPGLLELSGGANVSPEGLSKGFTHGFVMTFADEASRDTYLVHPDHEQVKLKILSELDGGVEGAVVLDWIA